MMRILLAVVLTAAAHAQSLVTVTGTDFRDASKHTITGSCTSTPTSVTASPLFVAPLSLPFSVLNGAYTIKLLAGNYSVTCAISYGKQSTAIAMSWLVPAGGPYRIDQVVVTSPSGQQYTVLATQLAAGGTDGQVLTKLASAATGQVWADGGGGLPSGTGAVVVSSGIGATVSPGSAGHVLRSTGSQYADSAIQVGDVPTLNQNTSGTASNLSGTPTLPNGTRATTQAASDASTKLATTAYVDTAVATGAGLGDAAGYTTVSFSTTPTFAVTKNTGQTFLLPLTGNVSASTMSTAGITNSGRPIVTLRLCQDGTGSRTFVWPTNVLNHGTIDATASACSSQTFVWDGTNFQALGNMIVNGATDGIGLPGSTSGLVTLVAKSVAGTGSATMLANSNTVSGIANPSDTQVINYIDTDGVQHRISQSGGGGGGLIKNINQADVSPYVLDGTDQVVATATIPSIPAGGCIFFRWAYTVAAGTGTITYKLNYGSGSKSIWTNLTTTSGRWMLLHPGSICNYTGGQAAQQVWLPKFWFSDGAEYWPDNDAANYLSTLSVDSSTSHTLTITANGDSSNLFTLNKFEVWH